MSNKNREQPSGVGWAFSAACGLLMLGLGGSFLLLRAWIYGPVVMLGGLALGADGLVARNRCRSLASRLRSREVGAAPADAVGQFLPFANDGGFAGAMTILDAFVSLVLWFFVVGLLWFIRDWPHEPTHTRWALRVGVAACCVPFSVWNTQRFRGDWFAWRRGQGGLRLAADGLVIEDRGCFRRFPMLRRDQVTAIHVGQAPVSGVATIAAVIGPSNKNANALIVLDPAARFVDARGLPGRSAFKASPSGQSPVTRLYVALDYLDDAWELRDWLYAKNVDEPISRE